MDIILERNLNKVPLPDEAVGKDVLYQTPSLPSKNYIEVYVTNIRTPDCFWIQLMECSSALIDLQNEIRYLFYYFCSCSSLKILNDVIYHCSHFLLS